MGFFGEIIDEDGVEMPIPEGYHLRLLQACFNPVTLNETKTKTDGRQAKGSSPITLTVTTGEDERQLILCVINPATGHYQAQVGHTFGPEDGPVIFQVTGGELHVTGEWLWEEEGCEHMEDEDEEGEGEDEESEGESVDEEPPALVPVDDNKKADKKATEKNNSNKKRSNSDVDTTPQPSESKSKKVKAENESSKKIADSVSDSTIESAAPKALKKWKVHLESDEGVVVPDVKSVRKTGGVVVTDYIMGKGQEPKPGASVKVLYEGYFPDGTLFDAKQKKKQPFVFRKGTGQVIKGMDVGLEGMRIGGAREVFIPYAMG
ncbi:hypothetical protein EON65_26530 [archaeon]|nr:MAG: hypothetical protein EON65_26530 [archaeon]